MMIDARLSRLRIMLVVIVMLAVSGILLGRLVELTVIRGAEYRQRADENRLFIRPVRALRGVIVDRKGTALVRNVPSTRMIDLPGDDVGPVEIEEAARYYPFGSSFAHIVGYIGEANEEELASCQVKESCDLHPGDLVGKTGLEAVYDSVLRGRDGSELVEADANGTLLRTLGSEPAINGKNIETTIDVDLQNSMTKTLEGRKGAVIALDPVDGSVLALVSSPSFDPNVFQKTENRKQKTENDEVQSLLNDTENRPLFDRAVGGEYPPGSVFKLVVAAAGLSEGKLSAVTTIEDTGEIRIGEFRYGNWFFDQYGRTEGALQLPRAITRSNDIFFYKVGEWVGPDLLASWAKRLGLGGKTGIDTTGESDGLVPDPLWKERVIGERWFLGNTYHMAIGQGDVRVTPLQAGVMTAAVVTGKWCVPYIAAQSAPCKDTGLTNEQRSLILEGMVGACSAGGTAFPFFEWNRGAREEMRPLVGCKTGTAQHGGKEEKPHAWITVVAPIVDESGQFFLDSDAERRIVLIVLIESAGEGSAEAAPVAKEILVKWFGSDRTSGDTQ